MCRRRRLILALALPWWRVGVSGRRRYRFAPRSVPHAGARWPLLLDHDYAARVGRAAAAWSQPEGLCVALLVARGRRGDDALELAADPRAGLSLRVDITDVVPDPDIPGVDLATRAIGQEVSITDKPAFPETRKEVSWPTAR